MYTKRNFYISCGTKKVVRTNFNNFLMDMVFFSGLNEFYIVQIPSEKDICRVVERSSPVSGNIL